MNKMTIQIVINHSILTKDPSVSFYPLLWRNSDENVRELARRTSHIFAYLFLLRKKINRTNISWYMTLYYISQPHTNSSLSQRTIEFPSSVCLEAPSVYTYLAAQITIIRLITFYFIYSFVCVQPCLFLDKSF